MRLLGVLNPNAGGTRGRERAGARRREAERAISPASHDVDWCTTESSDDARRAIAGASRGGYEGILLAGGDGTIHEALPALVESELPVTLLPFGRGNDFARNVGIPSRFGHGWQGGRALEERRIDLPSVNGAPFGSVACLGFDAAVNRLARAHGGILGGTAGYVVCVLRALASFRPFEVEIDVDGDVWSGPVMLVAVANGPCYGGGMRIAPGALMDDGLLDVCIVERMPSLSLALQFPRVFAGTHVRHPAVRMQWARRVRIETDRRREIWADGELAGETPGALEIGPRPLRVLVPARERAGRREGEEAAA